MHFENLLSRIEALIGEAARVPLTGKVILDADEIQSLARELRAALPDEVRSARQIQADVEEILTEAREEAASLLARAEDEAARRVDESAIMAEAEQRAESLVSEAEGVARELRLRAREYADDVLERLQAQLERTLETIEKNRGELRK